MQENKFFTRESEERDLFIKIPKQFMDRDSKYFKIKPAVKLLYGVLADRNSLSIKNKWFDDRGRIFFVFAQKELSEVLGMEPKTIRSYLVELEKFGLLYRESQKDSERKVHLADRMYLLKIDVEENLLKKQDENNQKAMGKNYPNPGVKITPIHRSKLPTNKTEYNKTNINKTETSSSTKEVEEEERLLKINTKQILDLCQKLNCKLKKSNIENLINVFGFEKVYKAIATVTSTKAFENNEIKNIAGYLTKVLNDSDRQEIKNVTVTVQNKNNSKFNNYTQREYGKELEDELIGVQNW